MLDVEQTKKAYSICKEVRLEMTDWYNRVLQLGYQEVGIQDVMNMRGYKRPQMAKTMKEMGLTKVYNIFDLGLLTHINDYKTKDMWGLSHPLGYDLLQGRYVIPIRDIQGYVTALVGWYPDDRKYITTNTYGFNRQTQFFNIDCYKTYLDRKNNDDAVVRACDYVILVEGIFDTIAVKSLGFSVLGNMGLPLSPIKCEILKRFSKVVAIPDGDSAGQEMIPVKNIKGKKNTWKIENIQSYVSIQLPNIKDLDDMINHTQSSEEYLKNVLGGIKSNVITVLRF